MTESLFLPGLIVLGVGSAVGWFLTRRWSAGEARRREASLEGSDLRRLRDQLYERLREPGLAAEERAQLEFEAAGVLRDLDRLEGSSAAVESGAGDRLPPAAASRRRPLITGFLFGAGCVGLIALLVFWAGRDAQEKDAAASPTGEVPHPEVALSPEAAAEAEELLEAVAADPNDIDARKRLALLFLSQEEYFPAFEQAQAIVAVAPDDIDALYVMGVVRMTMGQDDAALGHLDRVLELFPEHVRALTVQGLIFARHGERDRAKALWTRGLEIGGPQPEIENLLAMLEAQPESPASGDLPPGHPSVGGPGGSPAGTSAEPHDHPAAGGPAAARPGVYTIQVEADTLPGFPQTGTVFIALRDSGGGPPIAVKRIDRPQFPFMVELGPGDSMTGGELPAAGSLSVRLDQDGSASTRGDNDLEAKVDARMGESVVVFLE